MRGTGAALIVVLLDRLDGYPTLTWWAPVVFGTVSACIFFLIGVVQARHLDRRASPGEGALQPPRGGSTWPHRR